MSWDEAVFRARQEVAKRWDSYAYPRLARTSRRPGDRGTPGSNRHVGHFFFSPGELENTVSAIKKSLPESFAGTIAAADATCRQRFDLLGYEALDFGDRIDWQRDPVSGKRAPQVPFYQVRYLDYDQVGDAKVIWELNRHQHLVKLAKAWCFTQDAKYVRELVGQWYGWRDQNPYPMGINWASSLEVAFRCLSWLWVRELLVDAVEKNKNGTMLQFRADLDKALLLAGRHIQRYLSTYFSPNTHLLGEGVALFFLGTLCERSKTTDRWRQQGWGIVLQQAERQVRPDGTHFEQSTYYHVYALDFFLHARILAAANRMDIPPEFDRTLQRMLEVLAAVGFIGAPPRFGDDDGGRLFDPRRNRAENMLDPLSTGAVLYGRSDFKQPAASVAEETVWLLGADAADKFAKLPPPPSSTKSVALENGGLYVLTSGPEEIVIAADAGPQGAAGGGHGHADALSVQVSRTGGPMLLVDPGTYVYVGPDRNRTRTQFRGTPAHNTLAVDGLSQAESDGPFPWRSLPQVTVDMWVSGDLFDLLVAHHDGYLRLAFPVRHRRSIFGLKHNFSFVLDVIEGEGTHKLEVAWHCAPGAKLMPLQPGGGESSPKKSPQASGVFLPDFDEGLAILSANDQGWTERSAEYDYSPVYGRRVSASKLVKTHEGILPASLATVLLPASAGASVDAKLECLAGISEGGVY
ncbi:MAG: alginate lyase family protein, partial [Terriglobales bacterium]